MADNKESKPLLSGFMLSTQLMEVDGCTRCQECMNGAPHLPLDRTAPASRHCTRSPGGES